MGPGSLGRRAAAAALALAPCLLPTAALGGEVEDSAMARALLEHGLNLTQEGRFEEACPKFREAAKLDRAVLRAISELAECYEKTHHHVNAWTTWLDAANRAREQRRDDLAAYATQRAHDVKATLAWVTIDVPEAAAFAGLAVERNGVPIGRLEWGTPLPVDPGRHRVRATAPNRAPWETLIDVAGAGASVTVHVPALEGTDALLDRRRTHHTSGLAVGVAGLVTLGVAIVLQAVALRDLGACPNVDMCTGSAGTTYDAGRREQFAADGLYVAAGAALLAGGVVYFTAPQGSAARRGGASGATPARRRWTAGLTPGGVRLGGAW
jgi:hypothetical protein